MGSHRGRHLAPPARRAPKGPMGRQRGHGSGGRPRAHPATIVPGGLPALTRPVSIECIGFPGSGKTTVARELERRLTSAGLRVGTSARHVLRHLSSGAPRPTRTTGLWPAPKGLAVLSHLVRRCPAVIIPAAFSTVPVVRAEGGIAAWRERLQLLQYFLIDAYILSSRRARPLPVDCYVRCEGLVHHAACLAVHAIAPRSTRLFERLVRRAPLPDILIHVTVPGSTARERIMARGLPDMWHRSDQEWVERVYGKWTDILAALPTVLAPRRLLLLAVDNSSEARRDEDLTSTIASVVAYATTIAPQQPGP